MNVSDQEQLSDIKDKYFNGDYEQAFELCEKYADEGNVPCQTFLGWIHCQDDWKERDLSLAEMWFQRAINAGDSEAWYGLASVFLYGDDAEKAFSCFEEAAKVGYVPAICRLGLFYRKGVVVSKNLDKAYELFDEACKKGNINAAKFKLKMMNYGHLGIKGRLKAVPLMFYYAYQAFWAKLNKEHERFLC